MDITTFPFDKNLPPRKHDCWKHVGPGEDDFDLDLPAEHTEDDLKAALNYVTQEYSPNNNNTVFEIRRCYCFPEPVLARYLGDEDAISEAHKIWRQFAEQGTYIRPDILMAALLNCLDSHLETLCTDLSHYANDSRYFNLDETLNKVQTRYQEHYRPAREPGRRSRSEAGANTP